MPEPFVSRPTELRAQSTRLQLIDISIQLFPGELNNENEKYSLQQERSCCIGYTNSS